MCRPYVLYSSYTTHFAVRTAPCTCLCDKGDQKCIEHLSMAVYKAGNISYCYTSFRKCDELRLHIHAYTFSPSFLFFVIISFLSASVYFLFNSFFLSLPSSLTSCVYLLFFSQTLSNNVHSLIGLEVLLGVFIGKSFWDAKKRLLRAKSHLQIKSLIVKLFYHKDE